MAYIHCMAITTVSRTTISFTKGDLAKIEKIRKRENIQTLAAVIRWAINEVLK